MRRCWTSEAYKVNGFCLLQRYFSQLLLQICFDSLPAAIRVIISLTNVMFGKVLLSYAFCLSYDDLWLILSGGLLTKMMRQVLPRLPPSWLICQYHQRLALNRVHVRAHPHSVRYTPPRPIVYVGERAFAKLNACIATTIYFPVSYEIRYPCWTAKSAQLSLQ
jgi:hypothetical protein